MSIIQFQHLSFLSSALVLLVALSTPAPVKAQRISPPDAKFVGAAPNAFFRFSVLKGETETKTITLFSEEEEPFEVVRIESPVEWIKVSHRKVEAEGERVAKGRPGQNQYHVDVTVDSAAAKMGPIAEQIKVVTNSKNQAEFALNVSGMIRFPYRVEPTGINFGEVGRADVKATRTIGVRTNKLSDKGSFQVLKVESDLPEAISVSFKPTDMEGEFELTLIINKDAKAGPFVGVVQIHTNDKQAATFTVPVKGTVQ